MSMAVGDNGWAGQALKLAGLDADGNDTTLARVWLNEQGQIVCDEKRFLDEWEHEGIVGRSSSGRLFPKDGQRFLDELPFAYKSAYCRAEPVKLFDLLVQTRQR